jgi:hypothetical protein
MKKPVRYPVIILALLSILTMLIVACNQPAQPGDSATPTPEEAVSEEVVGQSIDIVILESFPVQVHAIVRGTLPDACSFVERVDQAREGNAFQIEMTIARHPNMRCAPQATPFEETVPLDVHGLPAGTYTVTAHGATATFDLAVDNILPEETSDGVEEPMEPARADAIGGRVWHDVCAVAGGEGSASVSTSANCVPGAQGGVEADGIMQPDEPGMGFVQVELGTGACPSTGLATTTTDEEGYYTFSELEPGDYCVTVDALHESNAPFMLPGTWTQPRLDFAAVAVTLDGETGQGEINFGWDHQFLPAP